MRGDDDYVAALGARHLQDALPWLRRGDGLLRAAYLRAARFALEPCERLRRLRPRGLLVIARIERRHRQHRRLRGHRRQVGLDDVNAGHARAERLGEPHAALHALSGKRRAVGRNENVLEHAAA